VNSAWSDLGRDLPEALGYPWGGMGTIVLPTRATADESTLLTKCCEVIAKDPDLTEIDASEVEWWGPLGVAMLGCAIERRRNGGFSSPPLVEPREASAQKFFSEVGLADHMTEVARSAPPGTLRLRHMKNFEPLYVREIADFIASRVSGTSEEVSHLIQLCLTELLQNVFEHAYSGAPASRPVGAFIQCRWFVEQQNVRIAVVDGGMGIPAALRVSSFRGNDRFGNLHGRLKDTELIQAAVTQEGLTSRVGPREGGWGLKHLHRIVTSRARGRMVVVSHSGKVDFRMGSKGEKVSAKKIPTFFNGTAIEMDFRPAPVS